MKITHLSGILAAWAVLAMSPHAAAEGDRARRHAEKIHAILQRQYEHGQFNGSILVARNGVAIYRHAFGQAGGSFAPIQPEMPSPLASVSKQFTAMAVMLLVERGQMGYDDTLARHLPELAKLGSGITVRHLLTHTSGIPDVGDLGIDRPRLRERVVLKAIEEQHGQFAPAGQRYRYSNTGYILLAMIVERVAQQRFDTFLTEQIFKPVGMTRTRLPYSRGFTKGDSGIESTVDDLLKWDQALYTDRLVTPATLNLAFTPAQVREGTTTYGFGWNIAANHGDTAVWHTGNTGSHRAFIGRRLGERLFVAILTNGASRRVEIWEAIVAILHDRPYVAPKLSIAAQLAKTIEVLGIDGALREYHALKTQRPDDFDFSESELNGLGYGLLARARKDTAIRIFELNVAAYPASSNAHDSLGEAYHAAGHKERGRAAYQKALELDPQNVHAERGLKALQ